MKRTDSIELETCRDERVVGAPLGSCWHGRCLHTWPEEGAVPRSRKVKKSLLANDTRVIKVDGIWRLA